MKFDIERVRDNAERATTEDLLDRATVYRSGMEPVALEVIEAELRSRGLTDGDIERHAAERAEVVRRDDGSTRPCDFCERPAVTSRSGWHRLWGRVPVFPRTVYYCEACVPADSV